MIASAADLSTGMQPFDLRERMSASRFAMSAVYLSKCAFSRGGK